MMKNNAQKKENATFDLAEGVLPSLKPEKYEWEKKFGFEPWHLTTLALIIDVAILLMYLFINAWINFQLPIGYCALFFNFSCCIISYILLKKKRWALNTIRFTKMINIVTVCISIIVLAITLFIDSIS